MSTLSLRFTVRRRTAAGWVTSNEVLLQSEIGHETDTDRFKFGDGTTAWNSLPYAAESGGGSGAVASVNGETGVVVLSASDVGADPAGSAATAQAAAIAAAAADATTKANAAAAASVPTGAVGVSVAQLVGGVVPTAQIPAVAITEFLGTPANQAAMLALAGQKGDWAIRSDTGITWVITGNDPTQLVDWTALSYPGAPVTSVNGQAGVVVLGAGDVGADVAGAAAAAQASAIAASEPTQTPVTNGEADAGTEAAIRSWSPVQVWRAIAAKLTLGTWISGATDKATPVDADTLPLSNSASSNVLNKLTWANLKATLYATALVQWIFTLQTAAPSTPTAGQGKLSLREMASFALAQVRGPTANLLSYPDFTDPFLRGAWVQSSTNHGYKGTASISGLGGTVTAVNYGGQNWMNVASAASANSLAGRYINDALLVSSGGEISGYFTWMPAHFPDVSYGSGATGVGIFAGVTSAGSAGNFHVTDRIDTAVRAAGFSFNTALGDTNWQFTVRSGTGANITTTDTGLAFTPGKMYVAFLCAPSGGATTYWTIFNVTDGTHASGSTARVHGTTGAKEFLGLMTLDTVARNIRFKEFWTWIGVNI